MISKNDVIKLLIEDVLGKNCIVADYGDELNLYETPTEDSEYHLDFDLNYNLPNHIYHLGNIFLVWEAGVQGEEPLGEDYIRCLYSPPITRWIGSRRGMTIRLSDPEFQKQFEEYCKVIQDYRKECLPRDKYEVQSRYGNHTKL